jgi:hypothetical protein
MIAKSLFKNKVANFIWLGYHQYFYVQQTSTFFIDAFGKTAQFFPLIADGIMRHRIIETEEHFLKTWRLVTASL